MFASDWPHHDFDHTQHVFGLPFGAEARRRIMGLNAAEFFGIDVAHERPRGASDRAARRACRPARTGSCASATASSASSTSAARCTRSRTSARTSGGRSARAPSRERSTTARTRTGQLAWIWEDEVVDLPVALARVPRADRALRGVRRHPAAHVRGAGHRRRRAAGGRLAACPSRSSPAPPATAASAAASRSRSRGAASTSPSTTSRTRTRAGGASPRSRRSAAAPSSCPGTSARRPATSGSWRRCVDALGRPRRLRRQRGRRPLAAAGRRHARRLGVRHGREPATASSTAAAPRRRRCAARATAAASSSRRRSTPPCRSARSASTERRSTRSELLVGVMAREWGRRRHLREPRRPRLGGHEHQRPLAGLRHGREARAPRRERSRSAAARPSPEEIGEAVAYLVTSTYTTGAYVRVDGGLVIGKY